VSDMSFAPIVYGSPLETGIYVSGLSGDGLDLVSARMVARFVDSLIANSDDWSDWDSWVDCFDSDWGLLSGLGPMFDELNDETVGGIWSIVSGCLVLSSIDSFN